MEFEVVFAAEQGNPPALEIDIGVLQISSPALLIETLTEGKAQQQIMGSPFTAEVVPAKADAGMSTAFGRGLTASESGQYNEFTVQLKDRFGNDRLETQEQSSVYAALYHQTRIDVGTNATVEYVQDGQYHVSFTLEESGTYSLPVVLETAPEVQQLVLAFPSTTRRGGVYRLAYSGFETTEIAWDASPSDLEGVLE